MKKKTILKIISWSKRAVGKSQQKFLETRVLFSDAEATSGES